MSLKLLKQQLQWHLSCLMLTTVMRISDQESRLGEGSSWGPDRLINQPLIRILRDAM
jgi:hypothetical protein